ncbi:MAG: hypothetical protein BWX80_01631 [Candidatus Hydrogenedentes bacterium ADurb.Bin101]|nr:MAG: hypothetical protein BWX80_01631 [Candidatus Hydrogenedentes bacterium ADurb.Bin101]
MFGIFCPGEGDGFAVIGQVRGGKGTVIQFFPLQSAVLNHGIRQDIEDFRNALILPNPVQAAAGQGVETEILRHKMAALRVGRLRVGPHRTFEGAPGHTQNLLKVQQRIGQHQPAAYGTRGQVPGFIGQYIRPRRIFTYALQITGTFRKRHGRISGCQPFKKRFRAAQDRTQRSAVRLRNQGMDIIHLPAQFLRIGTARPGIGIVLFPHPLKIMTPLPEYGIGDILHAHRRESQPFNKYRQVLTEGGHVFRGRQFLQGAGHPARNFTAVTSKEFMGKPELTIPATS